MGEARQRKLAKEAGRPWKQDGRRSPLESTKLGDMPPDSSRPIRGRGDRAFIVAAAMLVGGIPGVVGIGRPPKP